MAETHVVSAIKEKRLEFCCLMAGILCGTPSGGKLNQENVAVRAPAMSECGPLGNSDRETEMNQFAVSSRPVRLLQCGASVCEEH
jgi:hypothetical protein